jgi:hypothetical protein
MYCTICLYISADLSTTLVPSADDVTKVEILPTCYVNLYASKLKAGALQRPNPTSFLHLSLI